MKIKIIGPDDPALAAARKQIAANPDWNLELEVFPWAVYRDVLMETLNADTAPNQGVFVPGHVWIPELADDDLIAPLDPLLTELAPDWERYDWQSIIPAIQQESKFQDQLFMIPYFNDAHILFFRKDLIELDPGNPLPEISPLALLDLAREVHHPPERYGVALKAHPSEILFDWLPYFYAAGGILTDADFEPAFNTEEGIRSLDAYCRLREFAPPETHTFGNEEIAEVLQTGQAALVATWGGQASPIFLDPGNAYKDAYRAAIFPHPCGGTWGLTLPTNQGRDVQIQTLSAVLRLNSPSMDQDVLLAAGSPIRETSYTADAYQQYAWLRAQYEIYQRIVFLPFDPRISLYLGPLTEAIHSAFMGEISPGEALQNAQRAILSALP